MKNLKMKIDGIIFAEWEEKIYKCKVQDVEENGFSMNIPMKDGKHLSYSVGDVVSLNYCEEGRCYYEFKTKVISKTVEDNISLYRLSTPSNVIKIQRRNYVRVNIKEYSLYKNVDNESDGWHQARILDISGGGLKLKVYSQIRIGEIIKIKLCYNNDVQTIIGKNVRCKQENEEYICALEFIDLDERERDKIIEKVFSILREDIKLV